VTGFIGRAAGVDSNGQPVRLGEFDSLGHIVGYIDEDGSCWESLRERDTSTTAGRYEEAMALFRRGDRTVAPDPDEFAREHCRDPEHREEAAREAREQVEFYDRLRGAMPKLAAEVFDGLSAGHSRLVFAKFLAWMLRTGYQLDSVEDLRGAFQDWLDEEVRP
jgi:hypothetical protein